MLKNNVVLVLAFCLFKILVGLLCSMCASFFNKSGTLNRCAGGVASRLTATCVPTGVSIRVIFGYGGIQRISLNSAMSVTIE